MKTHDIMRIFQVNTINTHLKAVEVSLPVIEYNFSPSKQTLSFDDEHKGSTKEPDVFALKGKIITVV